MKSSSRRSCDSAPNLPPLNSGGTPLSRALRLRPSKSECENGVGGLPSHLLREVPFIERDVVVRVTGRRRFGWHLLWEVPFIEAPFGVQSNCAGKIVGYVLTQLLTISLIILLLRRSLQCRRNSPR